MLTNIHRRNSSSNSSRRSSSRRSSNSNSSISRSRTGATGLRRVAVCLEGGLPAEEAAVRRLIAVAEAAVAASLPDAVE